MIGFLSGTILSKNAEGNQCTVLTDRVGYEVSVCSRTHQMLVEKQHVSLWIHTHVREDLLALYGFESEDERHCFRLLTSISGLGPRGALSLLSELGVPGIVQAIHTGDTTRLTKAPGIGKKIAQRIVLDLQSKVQKFQPSALESALVENAPQQQARSVDDDLTSALVNLGFSPAMVSQALRRATPAEGWEKLGFEHSLRLLLKEMSTRSAVDSRTASKAAEGSGHA